MGRVLGLILFALLATSTAYPAGFGSSSGLILTEEPSARALSLAGAFQTAINDVSASAYNPAAVASLRRGQSTVLYERGALDDFSSQFHMGIPTRFGGLSAGASLYDGGDVRLRDGASVRTVSAQRDLVLSLTVAGRKGRLGVGMTGKYLSTELAETVRGRAYAADLGGTFDAGRLRLAGALQNFGTKLVYIEEGENLPRIARAGLSYTFVHRMPVVAYLDIPYHINERETEPAFGSEVTIGPLAVRVGYRYGDDPSVMAGLGMALGDAALDYGFGMMDAVDARHRVSLSFRFGDLSPAGRRLYTVRTGDTLDSIAERVYGSSRWASLILYENKDLVSNDRMVRAGQRLVLP